jgi:hypothetical protein
VLLNRSVGKAARSASGKLIARSGNANGIAGLVWSSVAMPTKAGGSDAVRRRAAWRISP